MTGIIILLTLALSFWMGLLFRAHTKKGIAPTVPAAIVAISGMTYRGHRR